MALTLFLEGCATFILFEKVGETSDKMAASLLKELPKPLIAEDPRTTARSIRALTQSLDKQLTKFPLQRSNTALSTIGFRVELDKFATALDRGAASGQSTEAILSSASLGGPAPLLKALEGIFGVLQNSVYDAFGLSSSEAFDTLDTEKDLMVLLTGNSTAARSAIRAMVDTQEQLMERTSTRLAMVFLYIFTCGAIMLALAAVMYAISRTHKWRPAAIMCSIMTLLIVMGLGSVCLFALDKDLLVSFIEQGLVTPTLLIVFTGVLVCSHISIPDDSPLLRWLPGGWLLLENTWPGLEERNIRHLGVREEAPLPPLPPRREPGI